MIHVITLTYKVPPSLIEEHVVAHRAYLDLQYAKGIYLASGPQEPRAGGVILATGLTKDQLTQVMEADPFILHGLSDYTIVTFLPIKAHAGLAQVLKDNK